MSRILVALDVATAGEAIAMADQLRGVVGGYKIGSQLFTSAGPDIVRRFVDRGDRVFLDLKFHDIPNTVAGAVAAAAELGVWMLNVHASGGAPMMTAARTAADQATAARTALDQATAARTALDQTAATRTALEQKKGAARPLVIAVTVLTSLDVPTLTSIGVDASPIDQVVRLARLAKQAGLDGVVSSPQETAAIRHACGPDFVIVTPGIRGASAASGPDDQQRTSTPAGAVHAGSSYLVVGRPITGAGDPRGAAGKINEEIGATSL